MIRKLMLTAGVLALAACGNDADGGGTDLPRADEPIEAIAAPDGGDWSEMVEQTEAGGYLMGNPDAPVKLIEYGSYTCPACAHFDQTAIEPLVEQYVKTGRVSYEYRNFVRDPLDITAAIIARCGADSSFFPLTHALFGAQSEWAGQGMQALQAQGQQLESLPPDQRFNAIADAAGLKTFAAQRGLPTGRTEQCLANAEGATRLTTMRTEAEQDFEMQGTPTFIVNGAVATNTHQWEQLGPVLAAAVGEPAEEE